MSGYILESVIDDTYLHEDGNFRRSWHDAKNFSLKEATTTQRTLKLEGTPTYIRIYQDKEIHALTV